MSWRWDWRQDNLVRLLGHFKAELKQQRRQFGTALLVLLAGTVAELAVPWPLKVVIDNVIRHKKLDRLGWAFFNDLAPATVLWSMVAAIVVVGALVGLLDYLSQALLLRTGQTLVFAIRRRLYGHLQRLSFDFHTRQSVGDLTSRVTADVNHLQDLFVGGLKNLVSNGLLLVGMVSVMFFIDWEFTLVALAVMPALLWLVFWYKPRVKKATRAAKQREKEIASLTQETLVGYRVVQAYAAEDFEDRRFDKEGRAAMEAKVTAGVLQARFAPSVDVTLAVGTAVVVGFGAVKALDGDISIGVLLVFLSYLKAMYNPMKQLAKASGQLTTAACASEAVLEILDTAPTVVERKDAVPAPRFQGDIELRNVTFRYTDDRPALRDVSLRIKAGQRCVIVGPTGAGKSTLVSLLPRFIDPALGAVRIDGRDVREFTVKSLREQIAIVLQEAILFRMTVRENIAYGCDGVTDAQILAAAKAANAHEFIEKLPQGYDTILDERGGNLSGGQRQRLTLARAFLRDAPLLILDEPTTGLDLASESLVLEAIGRLTAGRTTLTIAHRLSTIEKADLIVVLEDGRVSDEGTHDELVARSPRYRQLYRLQVEEEEKRRRTPPADPATHVG